VPFTPGSEGAGEAVEAGPSVEEFKSGDRVPYAGSPGAYAEERNIEARLLFKLPPAISYDTGAAMMLKGLTAQHLLRQTYRVKEGDTILVRGPPAASGLSSANGARRWVQR
jgi:NADPH2:quinone reductase